MKLSALFEKWNDSGAKDANGKWADYRDGKIGVDAMATWLYNSRVHKSGKADKLKSAYGAIAQQENTSKLISKAKADALRAALKKKYSVAEAIDDEEYIVMARVSGGVTGTRQSAVKKDGKVLRFKSKEEAEKEAKAYRDMMGRSGGSARFHYWVEPASKAWMYEGKMQKSNALDAELKKLRELVYKDKLGLGPESKKDVEKIIDTLLASTGDERTFKRYYDKFMREHPDAMDLVLDELFAKLDVKTAEQFFAKVF